MHFPVYTIGHFINQLANPTPFEITRFVDMDEPDVADIHRHTFYEIIWIEAGQSRQTIDYQEYEVGSGMLFFISPGQVHRFEEWQPVTGGSIFFTEAFFLLHQLDPDKLFSLTFLDNFYGQPYLQPDPTDFADILHTITLLLTEKHRSDYSPDIAQSLLHVLLGQVQRCVDTQLGTAIPRRSLLIYKQLRTLIEMHFAESLTARDYADRLALTSHHLNHVVRQLTGRTTSALIRERIVLEAKRLLTFTDQSMSQIADSLGFADPSYFARQFRAETGQSPGEFQVSISETYRTKSVSAG